MCYDVFSLTSIFFTSLDVLHLQQKNRGSEVPGTTSTGSEGLGTPCPPGAEQEDEHLTLPQALVLCSLPDDS